MNIKLGDIYWVDFGDPEGSEPGYKRPCVVVQNNIFNQSRINTVVVAVITSNLRRAKAPGNVLLKKGDANLKKESVVNISQLIAVNKSDLVKKIGSLSKINIEMVINGVRLLIEPREL